MAAMLVSSRGCARDPPHHQRVAGAPRHPRLETEPKCQPHSSETSVRKSTTKSTNKVKNTLKQIICRCFYLTHIFEVSRFFWTFFFQNLQICMWWGVGRSDFKPTFFAKVQLSIEWCAFCMLEKVEPDTCTWCSFCLSLAWTFMSLQPGDGISKEMWILSLPRNAEYLLPKSHFSREWNKLHFKESYSEGKK